MTFHVPLSFSLVPFYSLFSNRLPFFSPFPFLYFSRGFFFSRFSLLSPNVFRPPTSLPQQSERPLFDSLPHMSSASSSSSSSGKFSQTTVRISAIFPLSSAEFAANGFSSSGEPVFVPARIFECADLQKGSELVLARDAKHEICGTLCVRRPCQTACEVGAVAD